MENALKSNQRGGGLEQIGGLGNRPNNNLGRLTNHELSIKSKVNAEGWKKFQKLAIGGDDYSVFKSITFAGGGLKATFFDKFAHLQTFKMTFCAAKCLTRKQIPCAQLRNYYCNNTYRK